MIACTCATGSAARDIKKKKKIMQLHTCSKNIVIYF